MANCRILNGDCREVLRTLPDASVHCCVTSPPYWGLRSYKGDPGMIGLEPTFDEHLERLVEVFREVRRVLRSDGTLWLNYGDAYAGSWGAQSRASTPDGLSGTQVSAAPKQTHTGSTNRTPGLKPKDLMLMPARVAIALQEDGWWLRSEIIWHKPNPMPESITDRPTSAHEKLFLLAKSASYFYDAEAVRVSGSGVSGGGFSGNLDSSRGETQGRKGTRPPIEAGANIRNVWTVPTHGFSEAHFATFPPKLVEPCIQAGTSERGGCGECGAPWKRQAEKELIKGTNSYPTPNKINADPNDASSSMSRGGFIGGGAHNKVTTTGWQPTCSCDSAPVPATVLDPFAGSGTVGQVALSLGRKFVGVEISAEYTDMAKRRVLGPLFASVDQAPP